jgi:hypothetical protein
VGGLGGGRVSFAAKQLTPQCVYIHTRPATTTFCVQPCERKLFGVTITLLFARIVSFWREVKIKMRNCNGKRSIVLSLGWSNLYAVKRQEVFSLCAEIN